MRPGNGIPMASTALATNTVRYRWGTRNNTSRSAVASISRALSSEEAPHDAQELRQPIVVEPVSGPVHSDDLCATEVLDPTVGGGIAGTALLAVEQKGRARDPRPQQLDVAAGHVVGRPRAHVVVELPAV